MVRLLTVVMAAVLSSAAGAQTWESRSSIPSPRSYPGGAVYSGRLYIYGGFDGAKSMTGTGYVYDALADTWSAIPNMPAPKAEMGSCEFNGRLFAISGSGAGGRTEGSVYSYDPVARTWRTEPSVQNPRSRQAAASLGNRIYSLGGIDDVFGENTNVVEVFDGTSWDANTAARYPEAPTSPFIGASGTRLFSGGGTWSNSIYRFDPTANSWTRLASLPESLVASALAVRGSQLYVVGGGPMVWGVPSPTTAAYVFDTRSNQWSQIARLPSERVGSIAGRIGRLLHVVGGENRASQSIALHDAIDLGQIGSLPNAPAQIGLLHGDRSPLKGGGWDRTRSIRVGATLSDPDGDQVSLDVKAWIDGTREPAGPTASSTMAPGGPHEALMTDLPDGAYHLSVRATDSEFNSSDWKPVGSDADMIAFIVDGTAPSAPEIVNPIDSSNGTGEVRIAWTPAVDANGPLVYHVRVLPEHASVSILDRTTTALFVEERLPTGVYRIQVSAEDPAGNVGPWSAQGRFHHDDGKDHAGDDADKGCGFGVAGGSPTGLAALLTVLLTLRPGRRGCRC